MKYTDYGPFEAIKKYDEASATQCRLADIPKEYPVPDIKKFEETRMFVIDFFIHPQRRVFEENYLSKFVDKPLWYAISRSVAEQIASKLLPREFYRVHDVELLKDDYGILATIVVPIHGETTQVDWSWVYPHWAQLVRNYHKLRNTARWTKKMLEWEVQRYGAVPIVAVNPSDQKRMAMVAEDFCLTNGFDPVWEVYHWPKLSEEFARYAS